MKEVTLQQSQREVIAILSLYDHLLMTIGTLSESQRERIEIETKVSLPHFRFEGFDSSDHTREGHYWLLKMFVGNGLYPDYRDCSLNTGSIKTLTGYRAMLTLYSDMNESSIISWDRLIEFIKIHAAHSDNYLLINRGKKPLL